MTDFYMKSNTGLEWVKALYSKSKGGRSYKVIVDFWVTNVSKFSG